MAAQQSVPDGTGQGQDTPHYDRIGSVCCGERCRVRKRSYLRLVRVPGVDCDQPLRLVRDCGAVQVGACRATREDRCWPCAQRWLRLVRRKAESGVRDGAFNYLVTATAPALSGVAHRRVDPTCGKHPDGRPRYVKRPGSGGHRPHCACDSTTALSLAQWNSRSAKFWNRARGTLNRRYPGLEFMRFVEPQKRGALHLHVLVRSEVALDPHEVQDAMLRAGFGCAVDVQTITSTAAALYASKYASKGATGRDDVPWVGPVKFVVDEGWVDYGTGEIHPDVVETRVMPKKATFRNHTQSEGWGLTTAQVRAAVRAAAVHRAQLRELDSPPPAVLPAPRSGPPATAGLSADALSPP